MQSVSSLNVMSLWKLLSERCMWENLETCGREMQYIVLYSPSFMMLKDIVTRYKLLVDFSHLILPLLKYGCHFVIVFLINPTLLGSSSASLSFRCWRDLCWHLLICRV